MRNHAEGSVEGRTDYGQQCKSTRWSIGLVKMFAGHHEPADSDAFAHQMRGTERQNKRARLFSYETADTKGPGYKR